MITHLAQPGQYLCFYLRQEVFGIPVNIVREITQVKDVRPIPQSPSYIEGVFNLRDKVIPVVSLRTKYKMAQQEHGRESCVIVIETPAGWMGVRVDRVHEVIDLRKEQIDYPTTLLQGLNLEFVTGVGKLKAQLVILLDLITDLARERLITAEALQQWQKTEHDRIAA